MPISGAWSRSRKPLKTERAQSSGPSAPQQRSELGVFLLLLFHHPPARPFGPAIL